MKAVARRFSDFCFLLARRNGWLLTLFSVALLLWAPELKIIDLERAGTNAWRLQWNSTTGQTYQVQRAKDDRLVSVMSNEWVPLLSLRAVTNVSAFTDSVSPIIIQ